MNTINEIETNMRSATLIPQSVELDPTTELSRLDDVAPLKLERAARTCTATTGLCDIDDPDRAMEFVINTIIKRQHFGVLEHAAVSMTLVTNRAIANQIVRHRMASYCQESLRYVKLSRKGECMPIILPDNFAQWKPEAQLEWAASIDMSCLAYKHMLNYTKAEDARRVLPLDTATVLYATFNLRELYYILYDKTHGRYFNQHAQPQVRELFGMLAEQEIKNRLPRIYEMGQQYKLTIDK